MDNTATVRTTQALEGQLLQIRYRHPQTGWCVGQARLVDDTAAVVGSLMDVPVNEDLTFYGYWDVHAQYGRQFHVQAVRRRDPLTEHGIIRYLTTARCPHLGVKTAKKLVATFHTDTLRLLREDPDRIATLKGVSADKARTWQQFFLDQQGADEVIVWLLQWDIDPGIARRLYAQYGAIAIAQVQANPYALAESTWGVGFRTADRMALSLGWQPLSPERLEAVWRFGLEMALSQGDCYQTTGQLMERASALLDDQDATAVRDALIAIRDRLERVPDILPRDGHWALRWVDQMEQRLAQDLRDHPRASRDTASVDWSWLEAKTGLAYADAQREALTGALRHAFSIVTGGPGTGKTTILNGLLTWLIDHEHVRTDRIVLAAPTARAAQRMTAVTGHEALTVHRLLGFAPGDGFVKDREDPIEADWLVCDEVSMMDLPLAHALWRATSPQTRVVWIGDEHQLPSVGPGSVLRDIIRSGRVPVYRLTQNFRSTSGITVAAHDLLAQRVPRSNDDVTVQSYAKGVDKQAVQRALLKRIQALYAAGTAWEDIQVLTPIRRGPLGTDTLNPLLRDLMNPARLHQPAWTARGGLSFRMGDRVMQTRNAYGKNVFNGDMGLVTAIRPDPSVEDDDRDYLWVQFPDQTVSFSPEAARDLRLAYATTVHKAQGSEYPVVLFLLMYDAYIMLYRNLVYTAVTRARQHLWLYTEASSVWLALKRGDGAERQTTLAEGLA